MISAALAIIENESQRNELSEIYEKYKNRFFNIALNILHNHEEAEDAVQNAFLSVAKYPKTFFAVPKEKQVSYLNVVIRNSAYKIWNNLHKIEEKQTGLTDDIADDSVPLEEQIESEFSCDEIYNFIDTLSEAVKTAIYLKLHLNLSYSEIAEELGISEEAAKKRITRAVRQIKNFMEGKDDE